MISRKLFATLAFATLLPGLVASVSIPSPVGWVDEGTLLLGELNCIACHNVDSPAAERLAARGAPVLSGNAIKSSPAWLRRWISAPQTSKPGTSMPSLLHGLPAARQAEVAESLTHYLVSLRTTNEPVGIQGSSAGIEQGRVLYHNLGCVACHAPETKPADTTDATFAKAKQDAVPLGDLARKYPAGELARFLQDPLAHRPGGRMPALNLTSTEASSIAVFLLRDQAAPTAGQAKRPTFLAGLHYDYFETAANSVAQLLAATPKSSGTTSALELSMPHPSGNWGVRFSGFIEIPTDGQYRFWTRSDDGSQLLIDGSSVVKNDGVHPSLEKSGTVTLKAGSHAFEVVFFQGGGETELQVAWAPPATKRGPIPAALFKHGGQPLLPLDWEEFILNPAKVVEGRRHFTELNCAACHGSTDPLSPVSSPKAKSLVKVASRPTAGCLADVPPTNAPQFDLSPSQRTALRKTLAAAQTLSQALTPAEDVRLTMARLNCVACHSRDGFGGPEAAGRADWFTVVGEVDLGDEGRLPPNLTGVGGKLKESALKAVLERGQKVRPYMATRMPVFGVQSSRLAPLLKKVDHRPEAVATPTFKEADAKTGWKLVGRDGLACVACHTFTTFGSMGVPALALDRMAERLEWDWFRRYLPDPAALRPGTRMPTFWPEGQAVNQTILKGSTEGQIQAIYAYLSDGAKAEVPAGLIRGKKELIVDDETVIYRNFIEGSGARAIGVGYPDHANLAFDAQNLRMALLWQGSFIDLARHSTDRGTGFEPPLGDHRIQLPEGPAFARLEKSTDPWPKLKSSEDAFLGYRLDSRQRPTFRYKSGGVGIEETPLPQPGPVDMTLVRTFRFQGSPKGSLWLRLATGAVRKKGAAFLVNDTLSITVRGSSTPIIEGNELRVLVDTTSELVVEMTW